MYLKIIRPHRDNAVTLYGPVHAIHEEATADGDDPSKSIALEYPDGTERTVIADRGYAFVLNEDGHTVDRL